MLKMIKGCFSLVWELILDMGVLYVCIGLGMQLFTLQACLRAPQHPYCSGEDIVNLWFNTIAWGFAVLFAFVAFSRDTLGDKPEPRDVVFEFFTVYLRLIVIGILLGAVSWT